ncbi:response regulator [Massilia horti]|uniref:Response regulator n=1 Tax=Massilia horti TaxID=2562153 RepID=A0A4Y9TAV7_9BURK|nr:response regulator [Massilia horti]TFW35794.1 response regulator [Massilia horti]
MTTSAEPAGRAPRVLLLDDDPFVLALLADMLAALGPFEVIAETEARSALAALASRAPDLLICDLAIPEMDGIEFLQAAASQGFSGRVVLLSGMEAGVREAAHELARVFGLRVTGVFRKPIDIEQLRAIVMC